jgi:hypothetical protein
MEVIHLLELKKLNILTLNIEPTIELILLAISKEKELGKLIQALFS